MQFEFETDRFPVMRARYYTAVAEKRAVRVIVIHSMEAPEKGDTAENVARYFQNPDPNKVSAHLCIDNNSIVQSVLDNDVAFAAPGANHDGIQLELAGYAKQTRADWMDPFSILVLENAANAAAQYCLKYNLPIRHLSDEELRSAQKGIVSHAQVSAVYRKSDHTDPGQGFPWDHFIERVQYHHTQRSKKLLSNS
ncbi:N-acetylmuramoyl-L-alanine amidase [candidate division KSB1 bacterium]|nr:N-acetylmuramoyl-L-alanine amidase [candidate division KSB1 bacterium]